MKDLIRKHNRRTTHSAFTFRRTNRFLFTENLYHPFDHDYFF